MMQVAPYTIDAAAVRPPHGLEAGDAPTSRERAAGVPVSSVVVIHHMGVADLPATVRELHLAGPVRAILTYHSVDGSGSVVSVSPEVLRRHITWLAERGPDVVGIEELIALPAGADAVALTFDDGFANFESEAWPQLRAQGWPVTLFVATEHVGGSNAWERGSDRISEQPLLGWPALRRLAAEGVVLGAHSATHAHLPGLDEAGIVREVVGPADRIEAETGLRPRAFAYPYGEYDAPVARAVRARYAIACTTEFRLLRAAEPAHLLPRLDAWYFRRPGTLEGWGSGAFRRYVGLRGGLRKARRLLAGGVRS